MTGDAPAPFTVWAKNPDTGKRLSFGFLSIEEAHTKMAQLKGAGFKAVEIVVAKLPKLDPPELGAVNPDAVQDHG